MRVLKVLAWLIVIGAPILLTIHFMREVMLVDRCLDGGGSFDYVRMVCDREVSHRYVSYAERHIKSIIAVLAAVLIGGAYLLMMKARQKL